MLVSYSMSWPPLLLLVAAAGLATAAVSSLGSNNAIDVDCPEGWVEFGLTCYRFYRAPEKNVTGAMHNCALQRSALLSVENEAEHKFIEDWLANNDPQRKAWSTSGTDLRGGVWQWTRLELQQLADLTRPSQSGQGPPANIEYDIFTFSGGWLRPSNPNADNTANIFRPDHNYLVYEFRNGQWGWNSSRGGPEDVRPYICEIPLSQVPFMEVTGRGHEYGLPLTDPDKVPRGPVMDEDIPLTVYYDDSSIASQRFTELR